MERLMTNDGTTIPRKNHGEALKLVALEGSVQEFRVALELTQL